jgi:antitoxin component YwqK of YwqJK toxin-antitoxin module
MYILNTFKKLFIFLLLLATFSVFAVENKKEYYNSGELKIESSYANGKLVAQKKYLINGELEYELFFEGNNKIEQILSYQPSGKLFNERTLINGIQEGIEKVYYGNGKLKAQRTWVNGKKHGNAKGFYSNGNVQGDWEFENGVPASAIIFYATGQKHLNYKFKNGKLNGEIMEYSKDGKLKAIRIYKNDKMIKRTRK